MELSSVPSMLVANLSLCMVAVSVSQSMGAARGWLALGGYHSIPGQNLCYYVSLYTYTQDFGVP